MVNGKVVFRDGVLTGVDERALAKEGEAVCTRVLRDHCDISEPVLSNLRERTA